MDKGFHAGKHRPKEERWEDKYEIAKLYKKDPQLFSDKQARTIMNWIRNQGKIIMTPKMELKWFELGEFNGISNSTMIKFWRANPMHEVCEKWVLNKKKQRNRLSNREKNWLITNNVLRVEDLHPDKSVEQCQKQMIIELQNTISFLEKTIFSITESIAGINKKVHEMEDLKNLMRTRYYAMTKRH